MRGQSADTGIHPLLHSLLPHFATRGRPVSSAIYGTISTIAVIVVAGHEGASVGVVLLFAAVSMGVIWAVHVYASALAAVGDMAVGDTGPHWPTAVRRALHDELGVLEGASAPLAILVLGALGVLDGALSIRWAVWCGVVLLTLIPLVSLRRRGSGWGPAVLASLVSGLFGLLLVALKVVVH